MTPAKQRKLAEHITRRLEIAGLLNTYGHGMENWNRQMDRATEIVLEVIAHNQPRKRKVKK